MLQKLRQPVALVMLMMFVDALGFATAFYYLCQAVLSNIAIPGYASIIISVLFFGGLQLIALGILGEYLGRLHLNVNRKPQYTVRQAEGRTPAAPTRKEAA